MDTLGRRGTLHFGGGSACAVVGDTVVGDTATRPWAAESTRPVESESQRKLLTTAKMRRQFGRLRLPEHIRPQFGPQEIGLRSGSLEFSTIRPTPLKTARILYSQNSAKTTTAIRPVTRPVAIEVRLIHANNRIRVK